MFQLLTLVRVCSKLVCKMLQNYFFYKCALFSQVIPIGKFTLDGHDMQYVRCLSTHSLSG